MAYEGKYLEETPKSGKALKAPRKKGRIRPWMIVAAVILILVVFFAIFGKNIVYNAILWLVRHFFHPKEPTTQGVYPDAPYSELIEIISGNH